MPLKRKDSYFGLHFDFHSRGEKPVAPEPRYDVIAKLLDEVKPDYVQIDTKGHPGYSSYPTRVGNPAPEVIGDQVKMWRELTAERGIALYGHHSGLFDRTAVRLHPEWAVIHSDGRRSEDFMSVFTYDYANELLIPQLIELALDWRLDGAWVDGETWGTKVDYSENARKKWSEISSLPPPKPGEEGFCDYLAFIRKGFNDYVAHYIAEVKAKAPDFEITSNWIYSARMPEKPSAPVDFLSGDYSPCNSVNSARIEGRFIACQGIPWDLMAWGHSSDGSWTGMDRSTKEYVQLNQEASYVMSLGGGFQFYNIQYGEGGTVQEWAIPTWAKTAAFVREREPYTKGAVLKHETAVFLPTEAHYAESKDPFTGSPALNSSCGLIHICADTGMSTEVIETHHLDRINEYKFVMLGYADRLSDSSMSCLLDYVKNGGSLLVTSPDTARLLGFRVGEASDRLIHIESSGRLAPLTTGYAPLTPMDGEETVGELYFDNYMKDGPYTAAVSKRLGEGKITALAFELGSCYQSNRTGCIKDFFKSLVLPLYEPTVTVSGSEYAEITLTEKNGALLINLLNHGGEHNSSGARSYGEIPKIGPLTIGINTPDEPRRIFIEPEHIEWTGERRRVTIDRLEIYSIIVVEF